MALIVVANPLGSFSIRGIPYITDQVPVDQYPLISSRLNMRSAFPYDSIQLESPTPTPGGAADEWYVKFDGDNGTAGQGGQGTDVLPRRTPPPGPFLAGTKIFIEGNNNGEVVEFDLADVIYEYNTAGTYAGTADICWLVGINKPVLSCNKYSIFNSNHLIMDSLYGRPDAGASPGDEGWRMALGGSDGTNAFGDNSYVTIRNCDFEGNPNHSETNGSRSIDLSGRSGHWNEFICVDNCRLETSGDWQGQLQSTDNHGIQAGHNLRYAWITRTSISHFRGNGIQVSNSPPQPVTDTVAVMPQFIYIGGNTIFENSENCIANKHSANVIWSENECYSAAFPPGADTSFGSRAVLGILTIDQEGWTSGPRWSLFNTWHDGHTNGLRDAHVNSGAADGAYNPEQEISAIIGNLFYDISNGAIFPDKQHPDGNRERYYVNNTALRCGHFLWSNSGGTTDFSNTKESFGNISYAGTEINHYECNNGAAHFAIEDSVMYTSGQSATITGIFTESGNVKDSDPLMVDPDNNDARLQALSPALGIIAVIHPIYDEFYQRYGIKIDFDRDGNQLPATLLDAGAYQRQ